FHGMLAGLTTAFLDFSYCLIALVGLFHISLNLSGYSHILKVIAGAVILLIGLKLIRDAKKFTLKEEKNSINRTPRPLFGVLLLYISNPSLYVFWLGVAGTVTAHGWLKSGLGQAVLFAASCGLGAILWYFSLVRIVSHFQTRIQEQTFRKMLIVLGLLLSGFAVYTFFSAFI
ncbi:MAG: LysE family transporter, partial [Candidatus Aminicenantes bacterium]|nr:LysE family transporter [Candidatus Aminicenantes bacterium]